MVTVRCDKCGAQYETELPAAGVERVRRCAVCHRSALVIVDDDEAAAPGDDRPAAESGSHCARRGTSTRRPAER